MNGKIYIIGGWGNAADEDGNFALSMNQVYDPLADTWTNRASMPTARAVGSCAEINGKIYVIGGGTVSNNPVEYAVVEIYDTNTNAWTTGANSPRPGEGIASWVANNQIHIMGGFAFRSTNGFIDTYDPATNRWTTKNATRLSATTFPGQAILNGIIYHIGGQDEVSFELLDRVEVYDPASNTWSKKKSLDAARFAPAAAAVMGKIYAISGSSSGAVISFVEEFNPNPTTAVESEDFVPASFALHQNYPNPFNPATHISYEIAQPGRVVLRVLNVLGQELRTLVAQNQPAGAYEVTWDGKDDQGRQVAGGIYLYRFEAGDFVQTRKMVLAQ